MRYVSDGATAAAVANGGTGYTVGDDLTVAGGVGQAATFNVDTVSAGVITGLSVISPGAYSTRPTLTGNALTGGTGASATANLTMALAAVNYMVTHSGVTSVATSAVLQGTRSGAPAALKVWGEA